MKGQAFGDQKQAQYMVSKKIVEINPYHPMVKALKDKIASGATDSAKDQAQLLFDAALVQSGFGMEKPDEFAARVHRVISAALDVAPDAALEAEPESDLPDEVPPAAAATDAAAGDVPPAATTTVTAEEVKASKDEL